MSECIDTEREITKLTGQRLVDLVSECSRIPDKKCAIIFPDAGAAIRFGLAFALAFDRAAYKISSASASAVTFLNGSRIDYYRGKTVFERSKIFRTPCYKYDKVLYYGSPDDEDIPFDSGNETLDAYLKSFVINADTV